MLEGLQIEFSLNTPWPILSHVFDTSLGRWVFKYPHYLFFLLVFVEWRIGMEGVENDGLRQSVEQPSASMIFQAGVVKVPFL